MIDYFPAGLAIYAGLWNEPGGREWLASLPSLVTKLADRWSLTLGPPFHGGSVSWVAPATLRDGTAVVLKVSWPHREAREEARALRRWGGTGACRLLDEDTEHHALLLERCIPGVALSASDAPVTERLLTAAAVLARLWVPAASAPGFETIADVAAEWSRGIVERMERIRPPYDPALVRHGAQLLAQLPRNAARSVLVHGDFNPGNVLSAQRMGWLAVDPKPMIGDPGYDPGPLLMQVDPPWCHPDPSALLRRRFRLFADALEEDADRLVAWSVARTVESALWSAARGEVDQGATAMSRARQLSALGA